MFWRPTVGDRRSRRLSERLVKSAELVREPQRSRVIAKLNSTVFISHTSRDSKLIGSTPVDGGIYGQVSEYFADPFKHSIATGAPGEYEKIVGLALKSARWILVVWTRNAILSDYVRAEVLLASEMNKITAAYSGTDAPSFPIKNADVATSRGELQEILAKWKRG